MKNKKCKRHIIHLGWFKNSSCKTWFTWFFFVFSIHHIKLSRFTNYTVQKFFKVQILWIGISWYIHFIFWMTQRIKNSMFFFVQSGPIFMAHELIDLCTPTGPHPLTPSLLHPPEMVHHMIPPHRSRLPNRSHHQKLLAPRKENLNLIIKAKIPERDSCTACRISHIFIAFIAFSYDLLVVQYFCWQVCAAHTHTHCAACSMSTSALSKNEQPLHSGLNLIIISDC